MLNNKSTVNHNTDHQQSNSKLGATLRSGGSILKGRNSNLAITGEVKSKTKIPLTKVESL